MWIKDPAFVSIEKAQFSFYFARVSIRPLFSKSGDAEANDLAKYFHLDETFFGQAAFSPIEVGIRNADASGSKSMPVYGG